MSRPPNILLVSFDALRRDFVRAYNAAAGPSVFDRAAHHGIVFDTAFGSGNWTVPSHASLFSGLEPHEHSIHGWRQRISRTTPTLFDDAVAAGYRLAMLASPGVRKIVDDRIELFDLYADSHDERWQDISGGPWLVFWHFLDTHVPYNILPPRQARPDRVDWEVSSAAVNYLRELVCTDQVDVIRRKVMDNLSALSRLVERLWDRLGSNTIVLLLSDHGEDWRPHLPFHCSFQEAVLRIPLILVGPGIRAGRSSQLVSHADVRPLMVALMETEECHRQDVLDRWTAGSETRGRVVTSGPDAFDNDETFFATCRNDRMVIAKPSTDERQYYELTGAERRPASRDVPGFDTLEEALDEVLGAFREPIAESTMSDDDAKALLQHLEGLGYL